MELKAEQVLYRGACDNSKGRYPLSKKGHSMETLRAKLHLRPRTNIIAGGHTWGRRGFTLRSAAAPAAPRSSPQLHVLQS